MGKNAHGILRRKKNQRLREKNILYDLILLLKLDKLSKISSSLQ